MLYAGFSANESTSIIVWDKTIHSTAYQDMLVETLLPTAPLITCGNYLYQHIIATIHASRTSKSWFEVNFVKYLDCLSRN